MNKKKMVKQNSVLYVLIAGAMLCQMPCIVQAEQDTESQQYSFDQVVVTANRVPTPVGKVAANVTVINREQIENGHYTNLADLLRETNGNIISDKGFGSAKQTIRLNGDDRVLVMIDGRRINRQEGAGTGRAGVDFSTIVSLANIECIEIVKGGASALYGSDAVGGVINIITRKGKENKTTLDMATGSWGLRNYSFSTQGSEKGLSWFITADRKNQAYAKYNVLNPALVTDSGSGDSIQRPNSKFEEQGFTMRLDKEIDNNRSVTFNFEHWDNKGGQPDSYYYPLTDKAAHLSNNVALTYNFDQDEDVPGFIRLYTNYTHQSSQGTYKSRTQGFQYQTGWQLDSKNKLIAGVEGEKGEVLESSSYDGTINYKDKSVTNTAAYLQDIYNLSDKWIVAPGLRYDYHSKFGGQTSPKLSVNYSADSTTDWYVSYNRVFKAPTMDDLYYYTAPHPVWGAGMYGNTNLKPEKGYVISAGVNKKISDSTVFKANYFVSKLTDAIAWAADDPSDWMSDWRVQNINEQKKHGIELDLNHQFSPKYYTALGYSYVKVEEKAADSDYAVDKTNSQPNGYRVKVGYNDTQWDVNVSGQGVSGRDTSRFITSNYWVWNLAANYKVDQNTGIYFNVFNLGDKAYEVISSGTLSSAGDSRGAYPMRGRHYQLGVKYSF
ncbi:TonB-dependent receptor plug domain-containing protein [Sporomusa malonica]|uniref:Vitamin B12 transporter n=1 Tax=Sporomusa malonica TaxID=112901 RepID=A0A1W2EL86_9FIRM|nr:TonB-dependent receptor [Sporomusa malonica]SMD10056.1 vitamin B12 transporter [Sporomusa malonica]